MASIGHLAVPSTLPRSRTIRLLLVLLAVAGTLLVPARSSHASFQTKGARILALDVGNGDEDFEEYVQALDHAHTTGVVKIDAAVLNVNWNEIEPSPLTYEDPGKCDPAGGDDCPNNEYQPGVFERARSLFIPRGIKVVLNLRPIMGSVKVTASDLLGLHWNDVTLMTRFHYVLQAANALLTDGTGTVGVSLMSLGTEADNHLTPGDDLILEGTDASTDYVRYKVFYQDARDYARTLPGWSNLPIGVCVTRDGAVNDPAGGVSESDGIAELYNPAGDVTLNRIMFTYYAIDGAFQAQDPFNDPINKINAMIGHPNFAGKRFDIIEAGYPTSPVLNGSLAKQETFVLAMFGIWDEYATPNPNAPIIYNITFNWESDLSPLANEFIVNSPWFGAAGTNVGLPGTPAAPTASAVAVGATGSTTWKYVVNAVNASGDSLDSAEAVVTNGNATLSASNYNRISWPAVSGATSYRVKRTAVGGGAAVPSPSEPGVLGTTTSLEFWDVGLNPTSGVPPRPNVIKVTPYGAVGQTLWEYYVVAVNASGDSVPSIPAQNWIGVKNLTTINKNHISWPAVSGATSYKVYRSIYGSNATPNTVGMIGTTTSTSFDDTGLPPTPAGAPGKPKTPTVTPTGGTGSTEWKYYIVAVNASGNSMPSFTSATTTGVATLSSSTKNVVTWPAVSGATSYKVYRAHVGAGGSPASIGLIGTTSSTTFNDTGVAAAVGAKIVGAPTVSKVGSGSATKTWRYFVTSRRVWGNEGLGQYFDSLPSGVGEIFSHATLTASKYNRITWNTVPGTTRYSVYRTYVEPGGSPSSIWFLGTTTSTTFDDKGIAGSSTPAGTFNFYEFIATLGLRTFSPVADKPGFDRFEIDACARLWC